MAGKYIEFINPGYSTLYTKDVGYAANTVRDGDDPANPFNPDSANPLLEGEFLEMSSSNKVTRGGTTSPATAGANIAEKPCFLHFSERGRYDAQLTQKAHLVVGPAGFEFRSKLCVAASSEVGDMVFVADVASPSAAGKFVKGLVGQGDLGSATGTFYSVGFITRKHSDSDIQVMYMPQMVVI